MEGCYPDKVVCMGDGLKFGYLNQDICSTIDTRMAGRGELKVSCTGPTGNAMCELRDHRDNSFTLTIRAQEVGRHHIHVTFDDQDVPGSPFQMRVSSANMLKIYGPGLQDGVFTSQSSEFSVETSDAGEGQVKIKIGGPKGAFKVQTQKESSKKLNCRYHPISSGLYVISITWDGDQIPGSPFQVYWAATDDELRNYMYNQARA